MRKKDPELMKQITEFAEQYYLENFESPSISTIADAVGVAKTTAYRYVKEMDEKGLIEYNGKDIATNVTKKFNMFNSPTPILGAVPCGALQIEEGNVEAYVNLPIAIFGKGDFFILRASGNSMIEAGISDGDYVVIKKQNTAEEGDIIVALVENQNTLKRLYYDNENKKIILHPENKTMEDIVVDECYIQGIACNVIKSL